MQFDIATKIRSNDLCPIIFLNQMRFTLVSARKPGAGVDLALYRKTA